MVSEFEGGLNCSDRITGWGVATAASHSAQAQASTVVLAVENIRRSSYE